MRKFGIIAVLLIACFLVAATPASARITEPGSCTTVHPKETWTYDFAPYTMGDWTCKLTINYPNVIGAKPQKVSFAWRYGSGTYHTWYTTTMTSGKTVIVPFHSGRADVNYLVTVYNPSSVVPSSACISIL